MLRTGRGFGSGVSASVQRSRPGRRRGRVFHVGLGRVRRSILRRRLAAAASAIALSYALLVAAFALWIANAIPAAVLFLLAPIAVAVALWRFLHLDTERRRGGIAADS